jgi:hypothetical protein
MSTLVEHPGTGVAVRPGKKKTGTSLISATLDTVAHPLRIASHCRDELREVLQHVDDVPQPNIVNLPAARFNHARMLSRVAVVREVHLGLFGMFIPPAPTTTRGDAIDMLSALFGATAKAKAESKTLLAACVSMFAPGADSVALATGLWQPISRHPVVVAIAIQELINTAVFTPTPAEFRAAMVDAKRKLRGLATYAESWLELLQVSDRVVFDFDRPAWEAAYAGVGADVIGAMQVDEEGGYEGDEDDDGEPASPRYAALEQLLAKLAAEGGPT